MAHQPLYSLRDIASFVDEEYCVVHAYISYHYPELMVRNTSLPAKYHVAKIRIPKPTADKLIKEIIEHRKKKLSLN